MCGIWASLLSNHADIKLLESYFQLIKHRGPDYHSFQSIDQQVLFGFHRLSIIDPSEQSNQPLISQDCYLICNGEIYNYQSLIKDFDLPIKTRSDCEVILHLYLKFGIEQTVKLLDAEFAFILYDQRKQLVFVARDPFGVRPLFWGKENDSFYFSSELMGIKFCQQVDPFIPGNYIMIDLKQNNQVNMIQYHSYFQLSKYNSLSIDYSNAKTKIHELLTQAVKKRLMSDRPLGCLLSGGVDSSLITSIVSKLVPNAHEKLHCFTVGMVGSVDVIAAKQVAEYLNLKNHHIVEFTTEDGFNALPIVIILLGTYDVTTIRASIPQYIMSKYISKSTDIKVLLSGEGSDELFASYQYFKKAPNAIELYQDSNRLLNELYLFDNKRTDRTMSSCSLEVRVPFLDQELVKFVTGMPSEYRQCHDKMEKTILRESFVDDYLPHEILFRSKEAFSDAVSSKEKSWYKSLVELIEKRVSEQDLELAKQIYQHNPPQTREALYYRQLFDKFYPNKSHILPHYWMPRWVDLNGKWDPSATVLDCHQGDL